MIKNYFITPLIISLVLMSQKSKANENESQDFLKIISQELFKNLKTQTQSQEEALRSFLENIPLGTSSHPIPPECNPHEFTTHSLASYQDANKFAQLTKEYFNKCSSYLTRGNLKGLLGLIQFATVQYDLKKNPSIQFVNLNLSDGSKLEAYIGVKDLTTPRPWVIIKCGVFCDVTSSPSMTNFVIHFFDQSPFNIILVSNYTGHNYIKNNYSLRMGGFYEAYDLYDIGRWLKNESPYKETIDSLHAVGISLGGSAALGVSRLQNLFQAAGEKALFNSSTAICPVVNLGPTLKDMYAPTKKGKIFTAVTWKYFKDAAPYLNEAQDYLDSYFPPKAELFPQMLTDIVLRYGEIWERTSPPGRTAPIPTGTSDFLDKNQFSQSGEIPLEIPTFAWASADDNVVNFDLNTKTLIDASNSPSTLGALGLAYGDHCGFATAYGYATTTAVLQSFVINNSPHFKSKFQMIQRDLPSNNKLPFSKKEVHLRQWWVAQKNSSDVNLYYETFDPSRHFSCRFKKPYSDGSLCHRRYSQSIPLNIFDSASLKAPTTSTEAQILTRRLNGSIRITNTSQPIDGTNLSPTHLSWRNF